MVTGTKRCGKHVFLYGEWWVPGTYCRVVVEADIIVAIIDRHVAGMEEYRSHPGTGD